MKIASHSVRFATVIVAGAVAIATAQANEPRAVAIQASDGLLISGDFYGPLKERPPAPFVILVHGYQQDRTCWKPLIQPLLDAGFAVLAIDLRGHGQSMTEQTRNRMADRDPLVVADIHRDLWAAYDWIATQPEVDRARFAMIGIDLGGAAAVRYATRDRSVDAIVCLTPAAETIGIDTRSDLAKLPGRDVLLIAGHDDGASRQACKELAKLARGAEALTCMAGGTGAGLLEAEKGLPDRIAGYLKKAVGRPAAKPVYGKIDHHIYHLPGSGWIERISATNLRVFSSAQEAESRGIRKSYSAGPNDKKGETNDRRKDEP